MHKKGKSVLLLSFISLLIGLSWLLFNLTIHNEIIINNISEGSMYGFIYQDGYLKSVSPNPTFEVTLDNTTIIKTVSLNIEEMDRNDFTATVYTLGGVISYK